MTDEKMLQLLIEIGSHLDDFNKGEGSAYKILCEGVLDDIRTKENKRSGAGKVEKLAKDILKVAKKQGNRAMQGSWIDSKGRQVVCDGHRILWINKPIELPVLDEDITPLQSDRIEPQGYEYADIELPKLSELKANIKIAKAENKGRGCKGIATCIDKQVVVDAEFLALGMECLNANRLFLYSEDKRRTANVPVYMESDIGKYLICPINHNGTMEEVNNKCWGV